MYTLGAGNTDHGNLEFWAHNMIIHLINVCTLVMHARTQWLKYIDQTFMYSRSVFQFSESLIFLGHDDCTKAFKIFRVKYLHSQVEWYNSIKPFWVESGPKAMRSDILYFYYLSTRKSMITSWLNFTANVYLWMLWLCTCYLHLNANAAICIWIE